MLKKKFSPKGLLRQNPNIGGNVVNIEWPLVIHGDVAGRDQWRCD
jgi:hypothetical protein